jgi:hypothetical protein
LIRARYGLKTPDALIVGSGLAPCIEGSGVVQTTRVGQRGILLSRDVTQSL